MTVENLLRQRQLGSPGQNVSDILQRCQKLFVWRSDGPTVFFLKRRSRGGSGEVATTESCGRSGGLDGSACETGCHLERNESGRRGSWGRCQVATSMCLQHCATVDWLNKKYHPAFVYFVAVSPSVGLARSGLRFRVCASCASFRASGVTIYHLHMWTALQPPSVSQYQHPNHRQPGRRGANPVSELEAHRADAIGCVSSIRLMFRLVLCDICKEVVL